MLCSLVLFFSACTTVQCLYSPCVQYLEDLKYELADAEGKPKDVLASPTSVFCMPDHDLSDELDPYLNEVDVLNEMDLGCYSIHKFLFDWNSISSNENLVLGKSFVRVLIETNLTANDLKNVLVNVSVSVQSILETESKPLPDMEPVTWEPVAVVEIGHNTAELDLEIEQQLAAVWDLKESHSLVSIQFKFEVDCEDPQDGEAPYELWDKTHLTEPFLVVFADNPYVRKQIVKMELLRLRALNVDDNTDQQERVKRDLSLCSRENFTADFLELGLINILDPQTVDIGQCVGDCSFITALTNGELFNYHAAIMTVVVLSQQGTSPYYPCCIPIRYSFKYLLIVTPDLTYAMEMEPIAVDECGCR